MDRLFMADDCFMVNNRFANDMNALIMMVHRLSFDLSNDSVRMFVNNRFDHFSSEVLKHSMWLSFLSHGVGRGVMSRFVVSLLVDGLLDNIGAVVGLTVVMSGGWAALVVVSLVKDLLDEFEFAVPVRIICGVFLGAVCWSSQINGVFFLLGVVA